MKKYLTRGIVKGWTVAVNNKISFTYTSFHKNTIIFSINMTGVFICI